MIALVAAAALFATACVAGADVTPSAILGAAAKMKIFEATHGLKLATVAPNDLPPQA